MTSSLNDPAKLGGEPADGGTRRAAASAVSRPARRGSPLDIREQPIPLGEAPAELFSALEQDARRLMRELGETRFASAESDRAHREHTQALLLTVLEAADAFDRVLASVKSKPDAVTPQMQIWLSNFRTARVLLDRALTDKDLVRIVPNPGDVFDPYWHSASSTVEHVDQPEGAIVEVAAPGWIWRGALLRKAAVVVVHHAEADAAAAEDR